MAPLSPGSSASWRRFQFHAVRQPGLPIGYVAPDTPCVRRMISRTSCSTVGASAPKVGGTRGISHREEASSTGHRSGAKGQIHKLFFSRTFFAARKVWVRWVVACDVTRREPHPTRGSSLWDCIPPGGVGVTGLSPATSRSAGAGRSLSRQAVRGFAVASVGRPRGRPNRARSAAVGTGGRRRRPYPQ